MSAAAWFIRSSSWAREYPLKKASLEALRAEAIRSPNDPLVQYFLGTQAFNDGNLAEALTAFEKSAALEPKSPRAYSGIALVRQRLQQLPEAYAAAKKAAELDPKSVDAQFTLALISMRGSSATAAEEFRKVTTLDPKRADAWHWLGVCLARLNDYGSAEPALRKATELEPQNPEYLRDLGKIDIDLNRFDDAKSALDRSLAINKDDPEALFHRGRLALMSQSSSDTAQEAAAYLERALPLMQKSEPRTLTNLYNSLADAYKRLNQPKRALPLLEKSRRIMPDRSDTMYALAEIYRRLNRNKEAVALRQQYARRYSIETQVFQLTERIKQDPKNSELRLRMARLFRQGGDLPRSENQYLVLLGLLPKNATAVAELAAVRAEMKRRKIPSLPLSLPSAANQPAPLAPSPTGRNASEGP